MFSKYSLLFTKRALIVLYTFGALLGLAIILLQNVQIIGSYVNGEGYDVPAENFYLSMIIVFLPFYIVDGYLLRLLIERWRVYRRSKSIFFITEYDAPKGFTPAHAGMLIDNDIRVEEVIATLYDLQRRDVLTITEADIKLRTTNSPVSLAEKRLIDILFSRGRSFGLHTSNSRLFLSASHEFRRCMLKDMKQKHMLPSPSAKPSAVKALFSATFIVFSYVVIVLTAYMAISPNLILDIQYPRYDMQLGQPIITMMFTILVFVIAGSGFTSVLFGKDGHLTWRLAAGYRLYITTVFKGKFEYGNNVAYNKEQGEILPYAIAFAIEKRPVQYFVQKLGL